MAWSYVDSASTWDQTVVISTTALQRGTATPVGAEVSRFGGYQVQSSRIRPLTGVVVLAGVMLAAVGAPSAAVDGIACSGRSFSVANASSLEGGVGAGNRLAFMVTTTGCGVATVQYRTVAGPSGIKNAIESVDYVRTTGTLTWTQYDIGARKVYVQLVGERLVEYDERLNFEVYNTTGWFPITVAAVGMIVNDDPAEVTPDSEPDCLSAQDRCTVRVRASAKASYDLLVPFSTSDGTATAGQDYVAVTQGVIVIPAGSETGSASVIYRPDRVMSGPEYFYINIFDLPPGNGFIPLRAIIPMP